MSMWTRVAAAAVLGVAVVGCGANGGDPVAGQQVPAAPTDSAQQPAGSGSATDSDQGGSGGADPSGADGGDGADGADGSDQGGSGGGGGGSGADHGRKVGLPESIRITEISPQDFENSIAAACGSKDGAPGCLTVTYRTVTDPDQSCGFHWTSDPPATSADGSGEWLVQRGSRITATIVTCPQPDDTTSPAPDETMSPAPEEMSTSDSPTASP